MSCVVSRNGKHKRTKRQTDDRGFQYGGKGEDFGRLRDLLGLLLARLEIHTHPGMKNCDTFLTSLRTRDD